MTNNEIIREKCKNEYLSKIESSIKQFTKYVVPVYIIYIISLIISKIVHDHNAKLIHYKEGLSALSTSLGFIIYLFLGIVISSIVSLILSCININKNFNNMYKGKKSKIIINILNSLLIYNLVVLIIYSLISNFLEIDELQILLFTLIYLLSPLVIPILKYINNNNYVSSGDIIEIILPLFIVLSFLTFPFLGPYISHNIVAFLMPCIIIGLNNKSLIIQKINRFDIVLLIINILLFLGLVLYYVK